MRFPCITCALITFIVITCLYKLHSVQCLVSGLVNVNVNVNVCVYLPSSCGFICFGVFLWIILKTLSLTFIFVRPFLARYMTEDRTSLIMEVAARFSALVHRGLAFAGYYVGAGQRHAQLSVLDWDELLPPCGPPRHHRTELEGRDPQVSGECPAPIQNQPAPRSSLPASYVTSHINNEDIMDLALPIGFYAPILSPSPTSPLVPSSPPEHRPDHLSL
ncbi:hypothetical protein M9458_036446 [Cirrhinus mrigala]|uniref:Uncharacterized protein n=1 Tax=Cirrhinus mrigala TaxID=683832 RepID=A0ABD0P299_CIRMR